MTTNVKNTFPHPNIYDWKNLWISVVLNIKINIIYPGKLASKLTFKSIRII